MNLLSNTMKTQNKDLLKNFDINKVKAKDKLEVILSVRLTRKDFQWLKNNRISATKLFNYALHQVMELPKNEDEMKK